MLVGSLAAGAGYLTGRHIKDERIEERYNLVQQQVLGREWPELCIVREGINYCSRVDGLTLRTFVDEHYRMENELTETIANLRARLLIPDPVDVVFALDVSGSMDRFAGNAETIIYQYLNALYEQYGNINVGMVTFGQRQDYGNPQVYTPLTNFEGTIPFNHLSVLIDRMGGEHEPNVDVLYLLTVSDDPLHVGWRENARREIVVIQDQESENPASTFTELLPYVSLTEAQEAIRRNMSALGDRLGFQHYAAIGDDRTRNFWEAFGEVLPLNEY